MAVTEVGILNRPANKDDEQHDGARAGIDFYALSKAIPVPLAGFRHPRFLHRWRKQGAWTEYRILIAIYTESKILPLKPSLFKFNEQDGEWETVGEMKLAVIQMMIMSKT